jgi:hypothetical protein
MVYTLSWTIQRVRKVINHSNWLLQSPYISVLGEYKYPLVYLCISLVVDGLYCRSLAVHYQSGINIVYVSHRSCLHPFKINGCNIRSISIGQHCYYSRFQIFPYIFPRNRFLQSMCIVHYTIYNRGCISNQSPFVYT